MRTSPQHRTRAVGRALACLVASALLGTACADSDDPAVEIVEPAPEFPEAIEGIALDTLFEIGSDQGAPHEVFEGIWDIEVDAEGRLAVLDLGGPVIHVFDASGAHIGSIDETGTGEGQLRGPSGIAWNTPGELLVWDPASSWVSRFSADTDVGFVDRFPASAFGETGFCAVDGRAYLSYWLPDGTVHEIGAEGVVATFGAVPAVTGAETLGPELQEIAIEELTPSALLCTGAGVVDVGFTQSNIRLHGFDGTEVWAGDFADFRAIVAYTDDGIGLGRRFDAQLGSHLLRAVVPWGDGTILVQHELRTDEFAEEGDIESRLINLADGSERARTRSFPLVLAAEGARLYLVRTEPYPAVTVVDAGG